MWSFTEGVKSVREDNREGVPGQAAFPHDELDRRLFYSGFVVDVVTETRL